MPCETVDLGNGIRGIVCSRGRRKRCSECGRLGAGYLCDWKLRGKKKGKTCDRPLCDRCATEVAPDRHLCRAHNERWKRHPKNPNRETG